MTLEQFHALELMIHSIVRAKTTVMDDEGLALVSLRRKEAKELLVTSRTYPTGAPDPAVAAEVRRYEQPSDEVEP